MEFSDLDYIDEESKEIKRNFTKGKLNIPENIINIQPYESTDTKEEVLKDIRKLWHIYKQTLFLNDIKDKSEDIKIQIKNMIFLKPVIEDYQYYLDSKKKVHYESKLRRWYQNLLDLITPTLDNNKWMVKELSPSDKVKEQSKKDIGENKYIVNTIYDEFETPSEINREKGIQAIKRLEERQYKKSRDTKCTICGNFYSDDRCGICYRKMKDEKKLKESITEVKKPDIFEEGEEVGEDEIETEFEGEEIPNKEIKEEESEEKQKEDIFEEEEEDEPVHESIFKTVIE